METSKLRAWAIGALYLVIALAGSLIASAEQAPALKPYIPVLSTIVTVGAVLRAFIDRTLAQVLPTIKAARGLDPNDAIERMPGVADAMRAALGDVPVVKASPLPAGPTQLAHLEQVADDLAGLDLNALPRNFSVPDPAGIPTPPVAANPFSQRDTDGRYLVDDAAALARAQEQARSAEEARKKAEEARRIQQEQAEQEQRRQAKIEALKAQLASLETGAG